MKENKTIAENIIRFIDITNSLVALGIHSSRNGEKSTKCTCTRMGEEDHHHKRSTWAFNTYFGEPGWKSNGVWSSSSIEKKRWTTEEKSSFLQWILRHKRIDNEEEDTAMISRKFIKFLRRYKFKKNNETNDTFLCFICNKSGYMKDCPLHKPEVNFNKFNKLKKNNKKIFLSTFDDSDSSYSNEKKPQN